jgi:hypothetical protein
MRAVGSNRIRVMVVNTLFPSLKSNLDLRDYAVRVYPRPSCELFTSLQEISHEFMTLDGNRTSCLLISYNL